MVNLMLCVFFYHNLKKKKWLKHIPSLLINFQSSKAQPCAGSYLTNEVSSFTENIGDDKNDST